MKNPLLTRAICFGLSFVISVSLVAGCGKSKNTDVSSVTATSAENSTIPELDPNAVEAPVPSPTPTPELLTQEQQNSINMLNYLTLLVQKIKEESNNRLYLEAAHSELYNNTKEKVVDDNTLDQYEVIRSAIENYRMTAVKRERLQYLYQQNSAHALRSALPNPLGLLSAVASGNPLQAVASVAYMALNSYTSYSTYTQGLDQQYLKDGWELDDKDTETLFNTRAGMFAYLSRVSREKDLPDGYALYEESAADLVTRLADPNAASRIHWLESHKDKYSHVGEYWLGLANAYYENKQYKECLDAVSTYESLGINIFRNDIRLAQTLPDAIVAASEALSKQEYVDTAARYAALILQNTDTKDWSLRYFAAQTYIDIYAKTHSKDYLRAAYDIALDNVVELKPQQLQLNQEYLADVKPVEVDSNDSRENQDAAKNYNKALTAERKIALPPVYEPLRLNCDLLVALANELELSESERKAVDAKLLDNNTPLFLSVPMTNKFSLSEDAKSDLTVADVTYSAIPVIGTQTITIPAAYLAEGAEVEAIAKTKSGTTILSGWEVTEVDRKKSYDINDFVVTLECTPKGDDKVSFKEGDSVQLKIYLPGTEGQDTREADSYSYPFATDAKTIAKYIVFVRADQ